MRRMLIGLTCSAALAAVVAPPAGAAATRAEYIAQADPICQSYAGPLDDAFRAYLKNFRRTERIAKKGSSRAFVKATVREANSLDRVASLYLEVIAQLKAVAPPPVDASQVAAWLGFLAQEQAAEHAAAAAELRFQFKAYFKHLGEAQKADDAARASIAGFGFQSCGVSV